ncbi:MAG: alpha-hydroxy acid oxidase [Nocardioides sp.]
MKVGAFTFVVRSAPRPLTVEDFRTRARRRLPRAVWAFLENGADDERTLRANRQAYGQWSWRQRVLAGVDSVDLSCRVAGVELALPVVLAPVGLVSAFHGTGDVAAARSAERAGTRHVLSTGSAHALEEVAAQSREAHWFQLYPWGDRALTGSLIERAGRAGFGSLFVTVDVPVVGNRLGERRLGMGVEPRVSLLGAVDAAAHPRWLAGLARHRRITMANLAPPGQRGRFDATAQRFAVSMRPGLDWDDLRWVRSRWDGPLFVKGILDPEDARRAVQAGADGVVVSNHGGRQLSPAPGTVSALPAVAEMVGERAEVLVDGGVRTGSDVAMALALGARAVLIGRPWVYGLTVAGESGVTGVLDVLESELRRTLHLIGVDSVSRLSPHDLLRSEGLHYSS